MFSIYFITNIFFIAKINEFFLYDLKILIKKKFIIGFNIIINALFEKDRNFILETEMKLLQRENFK